ncbi:N-formylglutamate amidohydrolase [Agaribacterium sp. ZY112]|uniref:N-formylglutamate amidohydrolase n=1 Tax=Agaribacterium sp. ZY112 TaxID=3233574 RepID=UPI0035241230
MHLSEEQICEKIKQRHSFAATIDSGAFSIKIDRYEPMFAAAIHNGSKLRQELEQNCLLSEQERYFEEDPHTGTFISEQAITLIAHDSRYEYDLNRGPETCVYESAWGKEVWKTPLTEPQKQASLNKHSQFFRIVSALVTALLEDFGHCIVYDTHSYNWRRFEEQRTPVFNLGTTTITDSKWRPVITHWLKQLNNIEVENLDIDAKENDVFFGKGNLAAHCHNNFDNVAVLATEFKKVFMDERDGSPFPDTIKALQAGYQEAMQSTNAFLLNSSK